MVNNLLTQKSISYVIKHILTIALPKMNNSFLISYLDEAVEITIPSLSDKKIIFHLMNADQIDLLLSRKLKLEQLLSFDLSINIPVFYIGNRNKFASIIKDTIHINIDIITLSFFLMTRYEETLIKQRDKHERFEYKNSLSYHYKLINIPIIDEYALLLRKSLLNLLPHLRIEKRKGKVIPTHDIDDLRRFGNVFRNIRTIIGGDLIIRKSLKIAFQSFIHVLLIVIKRRKDPYVMAIEQFIDVSTQNRLCSEFYFKGLKVGEQDCTYDIDIQDVKYCMDIITDAKMIIGIHGSLKSFNDENVFKREKKRIENVFGMTVEYGRQHFLKFDIIKTIKIWQNSGLKYDSTFGHFEREGFMCGTCHEYYLYDLINDRISNVKARPLIAMDTTLFFYRNQSNDTALDTLYSLYNRSQAVEGDFIFLWHNKYVCGAYKNMFKEVYCKFLENVQRV
jgi:hypothetical protein